MTTIGGGERIKIIVSGARGRVGDVNPLTLAAEANAQEAADASEANLAAISGALAAAAISNPYATNAAADAAAAANTLPPGALCFVMVDSTKKGGATIRQRVNSASSTTFVMLVGALADGFLTTVPVVAGDSFQQAVMRMPAPTSGMVNSAGGIDRISFAFQVSANRWNNGPSGHASYFDTIAGFGLNSKTDWTPENATMPSASYRIESKFSQGGGEPFLVEFHTSIYSKDNPGTEFRAFSAVIPHEESLWPTKSRVAVRAAVTEFRDGAGDQKATFDFANNVVDLVGGGGNNLKLRFSVNGVPVATQKNAANNADLPLPYYDNTDVLKLGGAQMVNATMKTLGDVGVPAMAGYNCAAVVANGSFFYVQPGADLASGTIYGFQLGGFAVGGTLVPTSVANNHATGKVQDRRQGGGDMTVLLTSLNGGAYGWEYGAFATGNKWKLRNAAGGDVLVVDGATGILNLPKGQLQINGTKVLAAQQTAIADLGGGSVLADVTAKVNAILAMLRAHGLIAT